jgi:hypothetical protein
MTCQEDPDCAALLACEESCSFSIDCNMQCASKYPPHTHFNQLMNCAVCQGCVSDCQGSGALSYCLD